MTPAGTIDMLLGVIKRQGLWVKMLLCKKRGLGDV